MYIGRPQKTGPYIKLDDISSQFNGSDVTFSLTSGGSPFYADNPYTVSVSLNGVVQEPVSAYTIVRDQITFASPPSAASDFFAVVYGTTVNRELRNATSLATGVDIIVGSISADNITSSGVVTATSFEGDGSQLTGIDATALKDPNGTVRVQANESGAVVTGVLTSTSFEGPLTGNVTGNATGLSGTPDIVVGTVTAVDASFSGNVSIAGTLTYEDVTNIDSIGLITARSGVHIGTGVTFTEDLVVDGDARVTGILTIGTGTVTIDGSSNTINVGAGVTLHTTTSSFNQLEVTGVSTFVGVTTFVNSIYVGDTLHVPNVIISGNTLGDDISTRNVNASGVVTATSFEGDGSQLTGIDATALKDPNGTVRVQANTDGAVVTGILTASNGFNLGISSTGTSITNGGSITTLNFVGAGNSISYDSGTRTVDISISSGSEVVIVDGGNFNSASSIAGAGSEINGGEFT